MQLSPAIAATFEESTGRRDRHDPVAERTGGQAGNGLLTAYLGIALLVLILGELVTVLDVNGMISWHFALGAMLVPFALAKTASTGWRAASYYVGRKRHDIEPPPMPMRLLGPLVVLATLTVLGTGLALAALGPSAGRSSTLPFGLDVLTLHQASFIAFCVVVGLHVLARLVPAARRATGRIHRGVPGRRARVGVLALTLLAAALAAVLVVRADGGWQHGDFGPFHDHRFPTRPAAAGLAGLPPAPVTVR